MNTQFHAPSFGDEITDLEANNTATLTTNCVNSSMSTGNVVSNNNANYIYQQQSTTPQQTKRMISLHNTSDEYHTANEDSFNATTNSVTLGNSSLPAASGQQQAAVATPTPTLAARKQMSSTDTNEPAKPLSAYALFFRDTVSAIKQQNPVCSFQELSKIVASMWDALDPVHKSVYNKKNELAKNEYIKQMRAYRQQQEQQQQLQQQQQQQQAAQAAADIQQSNVAASTPPATKPAIFTMNINQQQGQGQTVPSIAQQQQQQQQAANVNQQNTAPNVIPAAPSGDQSQILSDAGAVQKCTRDDCPKRAIINPDWEDEYCSNECVVIHCRNVFNDWVKSNIENKQQVQKSGLEQKQQQQQQQQQATT